MLELFPEGFEEVEQSARRRARRLHGRGRRGAPLARSSARARAPTSRPAGRSAGARSTGRSASAASGSARRGRKRRRDALVVVIDPGRAFGTGAHPTTQLCLELLQDARAGIAARRRLRLRRALDRGARCSASTPVLGVDVEAAVDRGDARERAARTASSSTRGSSANEDVLPPAATVVANISVDAVLGAAGARSTPRP